MEREIDLDVVDLGEKKMGWNEGDLVLQRRKCAGGELNPHSIGRLIIDSEFLLHFQGTISGEQTYLGTLFEKNHWLTTAFNRSWTISILTKCRRDCSPVVLQSKLSSAAI